jgi:L-amino acid N-acyltransferase YncA
MPHWRIAVPQRLTINIASPDDAAYIGRIYDQGIDDGTATFATGPHTGEERRRWLAARPTNAPVFCAQHDGVRVGWSALAPFSHRPWYAGVAEYTVYVARDARGLGVGGQLLDHLLTVAPEYGYWKLVGMILTDNQAGLRLAHTHGFRTVGTHVGHATLGGAWRDVTLVERHLTETHGNHEPTSVG